MTVICILLGVYNIVLLVRVFSTWFRVPPSGPIRQILDLVYAVTEPVLRPVRGLLPPMRMGAFAFDLSPIVIFVIIAVLRLSLRCAPIGIF